MYKYDVSWGAFLKTLIKNYLRVAVLNMSEIVEQSNFVKFHVQ